MILNRIYINCLIKWLFIIFFFSQPVYGQKPSFLLSRKTTPEIPDYIIPIKDLPLQKINKAGYIQTNNEAIPDSIYEMKKEGFITWYSHWYYHKSGNKLDSITRFYTDENGVFKIITESTIYNSSGMPEKFIHRQHEAFKGEHRDTTTALFIYTEEYEYEFEGDKIIRKRIKIPSNTAACAININEHCYAYNEQGMLISDIHTVWDSLESDCAGMGNIKVDPYYYRKEYHYYYNEHNKIEYELIISGNEICDRSAKKYTYQITDSTILTNIKYGSLCSRNTNLEAIDSLTTWSDNESTYLEKYDIIGRRTSLTVNGITNFDYLVKNTEYKIEFTYTDLDSLRQAIYYFRDNVYSNDEWKEFIYEDYTYNEDGNILLYQKEVYDLWNESWDLKIKREYYYNGSLTITIKNCNVQDINLYPNPADDYIIIEKKSGIGDFYYQLFNINGSALNIGIIQNNIKKVDISIYPPGIYYIIFTNKKNEEISDALKIIKY